MAKKSDYTPSKFHAREFKRLDLLIKHLTHAHDTRGNRVQAWTTRCLARIKAQLEDDNARNVSPRILNRLQRAIALNADAGFAPRGTAALVKALNAC